MIETKQTAHPVEKLVAVSVEVDTRDVVAYLRTIEQQEQAIEAWVKKIGQLVNDHKGYRIDLEVKKTMGMVCSACHREWDAVPPDDDCADTTCGWCGAVVEETPDTEQESPHGDA